MRRSVSSTQVTRLRCNASVQEKNVSIANPCQLSSVFTLLFSSWNFKDFKYMFFGFKQIYNLEFSSRGL